MNYNSSTDLPPLPYPVYFVAKDKKWQDLMNRDRLPEDLESYYRKSVSSRDIWSAQTYIELKRNGLNVVLVPKPIPGQICVIPFDSLSVKDFLFQQVYVVACRYDRARPELCDQRIVINTQNVLDETDHFVPHWPQPNLKPRKVARGDRLETLVFKGLLRNLAYPFQDPQFMQAVADLGIQFCYKDDDAESSFDDWSDYTETDAVLAVRNATTYDLTVKPAVKLINAWFAECPALLGPEPSYQELRQSDLDYIEVKSPKDVLAALKKLKENPELYAAMIQNGRDRAREFTPEKTAACWHEILSGPIAEGYEKWKQESLFTQWLGRPLQLLNRQKQHNESKRQHAHNVEHGTRLFSES